MTLNAWLALFVVVLVLVLAYTRGLWSWLYKVLSESDGSPSASRFVALLTAFVNMGAFIGWGTYLVVTHGREPDLAAWGTYMGWTQMGGSIPYAMNQLRRGMSERNGPAAPTASGG